MRHLSTLPTRVAQVTVLLMGLVLITGVFSSFAMAQENKQFELRDDFEKKLTLNWDPVRHVPTHVSVTKNPGVLTITTQRGSIHGNSLLDPLSEGNLAKNLHFIANPALKDDFVMTTCIVSFEPKTHWHQAGLMLYNDDDNYLKCNLEWNAGAPGKAVPVMLREDGAESVYFSKTPKQASDKFWLRVRKRAKLYQYSYSLDGKEYVTVGEHPWGDGNPERVGIFAKNGGNPDAAEIDVQFEFFEIRSLTKAEREDPSYRDHYRLAGKWDLVKMEVDGERIELPDEVSSMTFDQGDVRIADPNQEMEAEYTLDAEKKPKQMRLTKFFGQEDGAVAAYAVEKDELILCLDSKGRNQLPSELETKKGDGRVLFNFKRVKDK